MSLFSLRYFYVTKTELSSAITIEHNHFCLPAAKVRKILQRLVKRDNAGKCKGKKRADNAKIPLKSDQQNREGVRLC